MCCVSVEPETLREMVLGQLHGHLVLNKPKLHRSILLGLGAKVKSWLGTKVLNCVKGRNLPQKGIEVP